ncbi:MAG: PilZ domain-containing protein [Nitrospirota bacterium]
MAKRASWRIPINLNVLFNCCDKGCSGTITNLSEGGMFISTHEMCFPVDSQFEVSIPWDNEMIYAPARLVRSADANNGHNGIGVELMNPPQSYLNFVDNLLLVL